MSEKWEKDYNLALKELNKLFPNLNKEKLLEDRFKDKYKIKIGKDYFGKTIYYPQYKFLFLWCYFKNGRDDHIWSISFNTKRECKRFILNQIKSKVSLCDLC